MNTTLPYADFLERFGATLPLSRARTMTGLSDERLHEIARERGFVFSEFLIRPPGLEHLPSLPADAIAHRWEKGTTYTIPAHSPGYFSILIHTAARPGEDSEETHA